MRIRLTIEYDGAGFFGWQKQNGFRSVQETVETAIYKVLGNFEKIELYGAGRTDTGVHATGQVAHFDIFNTRAVETWRKNISKLPDAINFYLLDSGVVVIKAETVSDDFHARFSAKMRRYKYVIYNRRARSVIYENRAWHVAGPLNEVSMNKASKLLLGTHNLDAFRSVHCNAKNPVRTISEIEVCREGDFVILNIASKSFLHNQVRIIAGTLKLIGDGKRPIDFVTDLLEKQDRTLAGITAPPYGLYLVGVDY